MKGTVTPEAEAAIADIAERHGLSREAVLAMLVAVHAGGGTMAQFSIPELGGSGQWMRGGMTMVGGNMFDNALKARVDALCGELAQLIGTTTVFPAATKGQQAGFMTGNWWPADLGVPAASGGQNDARYAIFPHTRRLAIQMNGATRVFDTGDHRIGGVQQQQGGTAGTVRSRASSAPSTCRASPSSMRRRRPTPQSPLDTGPTRHRQSRSHGRRAPPPTRPVIPPPSSRPSSRWPACISAASSPTRSSPPRKPTFSTASDSRPPGGGARRARWSSQ